MCPGLGPWGPGALRLRGCVVGRVRTSCDGLVSMGTYFQLLRPWDLLAPLPPVGPPSWASVALLVVHHLSLLQQLCWARLPIKQVGL